VWRVSKRKEEGRKERRRKYGSGETDEERGKRIERKGWRHILEKGSMSFC